MTWTLRHEGAELSIRAGESPRATVLLVDDVPVDAETADYWSRATLHHGDLEIRAEWGPRNRLTKVDLMGPSRIPFEPPPDSPAGRRAAMARDRPALFVLRRAALGALEVVAGILGVSALLSALVPRIDRPAWLRVPDWLRTPDLPNWLRYLDPGYWLGRIDWPTISAPGWLDAVAGTSKYWLPIVIAVVIALGEVDRRRKRDDDRGEDERD